MQHPPPANVPGDLKLLRPGSPDEFWNYPRDNQLRRLMRRLRSDAPAHVAIFVGPFGSSKTSLARYQGMWSSCGQPRTDGLPCGTCVTCRDVLYSDRYQRSNYHELDGTDDNVCDEVFDASTLSPGDLMAPVFGKQKPSQRPRTILIDESQRITSKNQEKLLKILERSAHCLFIFATTAQDKIDGGILSRAGQSGIYQLCHPTVEEAATHLQRIARLSGGCLAPAVARRIADVAKGAPRDCLAMLEELLVADPCPTEATWVEVYGESPRSRRAADEDEFLT